MQFFRNIISKSAFFALVNIMSKVKYSLVGGDENTSKRPQHHSVKSKVVFGLMLFLFLFVLYAYKLNEEIVQSSKTTQSYRSSYSSNFISTDAKAFASFDLNFTNGFPEKYFVYSSSCHIPYIDPFTPDALQIFKPVKYKNCSKDPDLVTSTFNKIKRQYELHLNANQSEVSCCYQKVFRTGIDSGSDSDFRALRCSILPQDFLVPKDFDAIIVKCKYLSSGKRAQYSAFSFIQEKDESTTSNSTMTKLANSTKPRVPSVLMVGIDSLSGINFRRTMPLTYQYVNDRNWFELQGYNKVGDNTFPNVMAVLSGFDVPTVNEKCDPKEDGGLDRCNYTWDNYKNEGYHTAYAEDWIAASTFNYLKKGFLFPPTDYYLRPLCMAVERMLQVKHHVSLPFCLGQRHYAEYIYDYAIQFANSFEERYFGFFWTNSFSHNDFAMPSSMDVRILEYFKQMELDGILEEAIVIFLSDHGMRFGKLRELSSGFVEERLPMFYISLPRWFQSEHSDFVEALKANKNRLTSPFDVHITLNHILELGRPGLKFEQPSGCPKCQSIFYRVPENRTCEEAGISEHWCTCSTFNSMSIQHPLVNKIANLVIDEINNYLLKNNFSSICSKLSLSFIKSAKQKLPFKDEQILYYRVKLKAKPLNPIFETTVAYNPKTKNFTIDMERISRLNMYKSTSECVDDKQAKLYCICLSETTPVTDENQRGTPQLSILSFFGFLVDNLMKTMER